MKRRFSFEIEASVDGDTVKPGVEGRGRREALEPLERLYEGVLRRILGVLGVFQQVAAKSIDPALVCLDKSLKRRCVALVDLFDNFNFVH